MNLPNAEDLLASLAQQIKPSLTDETAMVGIHTGGVWIARRLHALLGIKPPLGTLDITFYRDDYGRIGLHPNVKRSEIEFDVEGRHIVLVDDVLYTGRTIRAAMNELFDFGRPASIRFAVLIDRDERELPIAAQYVGATLRVEKGQNLALGQDASGKLTLKLEVKH